MTGAHRLRSLLAAALVCAVAALGMQAGVHAAPARAAAPSRVSFTETQQIFMCTICHEPLNEARSPEAYQENAQLRTFIAQGDTLPQIKRAMVAQYGIAVLADPPARGFSLLVFIIPGVVIALGLIVLGVTIPRWRRRARDDDDPGGGPEPPPPALSDEDARRLDAELARQT